MAPPVDGEANALLVQWFALLAGVPRKNVRVVRGETGRKKVVEIVGITEAEWKGAVE